MLQSSKLFLLLMLLFSAAASAGPMETSGQDLNEGLPDLFAAVEPPQLVLSTPEPPLLVIPPIDFVIVLPPEPPRLICTCIIAVTLDPIPITPGPDPTAVALPSSLPLTALALLFTSLARRRARC